jgi:nitrogen fixation protein NifU and related proteins
MYSEKLLDHFEHPRNVGEIADADASVKVENPACGDIMQLSLRLCDGRIEQVRYRTRGCVAAIACGSAVTELLTGRSIEEAREIPRDAVVTAVGGLSNESNHASHLAIDAVRAAIQQLADQKRE